MSTKSSKNRRWLLGITTVLITLVAVGAVRYNKMKVEPNESHIVDQSVPESTKNIVAWGEVTYERAYDIIIDFPSSVKAVNVKEGDLVSLGQELLILDMSEYLGTIDKLQEQLEAGEAGLTNTKQDTAAISADIAQLQKDIETKTEELEQETNADLKILDSSLHLAKKELEKAKKDVEDNQVLYHAGSISKTLMDQYSNILDQRQKVFSDVENNIEKTKSALRTELDQLNLSLQAKQAQLGQIKKSNAANTAMQNSGVNVSQIDLDMMKNKSVRDFLNANKIVSSVKNGIVHNINVINGTVLGTQYTPTRVMQLIDADSIVVSAEIDEEFIKNVTLGKTASIVPTSNTNISIPGVVTHISNVAVEKDGKRIVKVQVKPQDPEWELKPGYSADVYFPVK